MARLAAGLPPLSAAAAPALDGVWQAVAEERHGTSAEHIVRKRPEVAVNRFTLARDSKLLFAGTLALDPSAGPARADVRNEAGQAPGIVWLGIHRVHGGTPTIVDDAPDLARPRPAGFATAPGPGLVLVLVRLERRGGAGDPAERPFTTLSSPSRAPTGEEARGTGRKGRGLGLSGGGALQPRLVRLGSSGIARRLSPPSPTPAAPRSPPWSSASPAGRRSA